MTLQEYKEIKKRDINSFLRGLSFKNIGNKEKSIVLGLTPECSQLFNQDMLVRKATEQFLRKVQGYKTVLVDTQIEFSTSKEQVDEKIREFLDKVRREIDIYKHNVIKLTFQPNREEIPGNVAIETLPEVPEKNIIYTGLESIKIQIGNIINAVAKTGKEAEKEDEIVEDLNSIIIYIYYLVCLIEDKKTKKSELIDLISANFSVRDPEYANAMRKFMTVLNEKDYATFIKKFEEIILEIKTIIAKRNQQPEIPGNKPKGIH